MLKLQLSLDGTVEAVGYVENYNTEVTEAMMALMPEDLLKLKFQQRWKWDGEGFVEVV